LLQPLGREAAQLFQRLGMAAVEKMRGGVVAAGQFRPATGVPAGPVKQDFHVQKPLDGGNVPEQVAEGEFAGPVGPLQLVGRHQGQQAAGAGPHVLVVVNELANVGGLHGNGRGSLGWPPKIRPAQPWARPGRFSSVPIGRF